MSMFIVTCIGFLVILSIVGTLLTAKRALELDAAFETKAFLFLSATSAIWGFVSLCYFSATWIPYDLDQCISLMDCSANDAIEKMVSVRWQSFIAALLFIVLGITCLIGAIRVHKLSDMKMRTQKSMIHRRHAWRMRRNKLNQISVNRKRFSHRLRITNNRLGEG